MTAASARIERFFAFSPESSHRPWPSPVAHSFYSILFSDAPRRLLIRQRIEEEARCHADASTETVKLPALFLTFRHAVNQRRAGARNSSKIHPNFPAPRRPGGGGGGRERTEKLRRQNSSVAPSRVFPRRRISRSMTCTRCMFIARG